MDTGTRLKIGLLFNFDKNWLGGIYYIINIIRTLDWLHDEDKPKIYLFYNPDLKKFLEEIKYPYLEAVEWRFRSVPMGFMRSVLTRKNLFINDIIQKYEPDGIYPVWDLPVKTKNGKTKLVGWFADLQHKHYPGFFSGKQRMMREARLKFMIKNADSIVVSSNAVANDFNTFYRPSIPLNVYHFVSVMEEDGVELPSFEFIQQKYALQNRYFIVSNQFHKHKNHKVVLEAAALLKKKGKDIQILMTGKLPAKEDSAYIKELHEILEENDLGKNIKFMGVIPRNEQLAIMKYAAAVIQPSLFEGWSTVIEDARSLQAPVIASSLPVNKEQLGPDGVYFEPHDAAALAQILETYPERNLGDLFYDSYPQRMREAAYQFLNIFKTVPAKKKRNLHDRQTV